MAVALPAATSPVRVVEFRQQIDGRVFGQFAGIERGRGNPFLFAGNSFFPFCELRVLRILEQFCPRGGLNILVDN